MKRPALFVAAIILVLCAIAACGSGDESDSNGPGGPEERTEFSVIMTDPGSNKVEVIKAIREITGLGLKEAKGMVEVVPCHVADGVSASDADAIRRKLESAGARVEIR